MKESINIEEKWSIEISNEVKKSKVNFKEIKAYRDLLFLFVKRDFISLYKQTILGPLWIVIQPILTTITFYVVFTKIAKIEVGSVPPILFYLSGVTIWTFFADCVVKTSETFIANQGVFGKVYFPRLITPLSLVITNFIKFGIQFSLFILIYIYFYFFEVTPIALTLPILLFPILIVTLVMLGLGFGLFISALTTKYRDLRFLIQFGIQLAMYATPIVWPLNEITEEHQWKLMLNPMTSIIECFKTGLFGYENGVFSWFGILYSFTFAFIALFLGSKLFSRIEKSFMDTI